MKIFDYKFIILLGLTLVVYFIYREVEYLRSKINKIEKDINNINVSTNDTTKLIQPTKIISVPSTPYQSTTEKTKIDSIVHDVTAGKLPSTTLPISGLAESLVEPMVEEQIVEPLTHLTKLPIKLSNNNPLIMPTLLSGLPFMDTQILINFKNDLSNMELNIIDDTNITSDESNGIPTIYNATEKINNLIIIDEDISEHCESIKQDTPCHLAVYSNEEDSCKATPINTQEDLHTFNYDDVKIDLQPANEFVLEKLEKYKLIEIKKIAEGKKININKKVNGAYKPKTKNELIMEIIELKNI
jgi:hypothetical protein